MLMDEKNSESGWQYETSDSANTNDVPQTQNSFGGLKWTASEYVAHQKSTSWYAILGGASVLVCLIVYLVTRNWLSSAAILTVCVCIGVFAAREPREIPYEITSSGVKVGQRFFPYSQFKSFSVMQEGAIKCVWLRSLKKFAPTVAMYFAPDEEDKVVDNLSNFLPHEERQPDAIDRMSQRFRF